jgi:hypothetical protein
MQPPPDVSLKRKKHGHFLGGEHFFYLFALEKERPSYIRCVHLLLPILQLKKKHEILKEKPLKP